MTNNMEPLAQNLAQRLEELAAMIRQHTPTSLDWQVSHYTLDVTGPGSASREYVANGVESFTVKVTFPPGIDWPTP